MDWVPVHDSYHPEKCKYIVFGVYIVNHLHHCRLEMKNSKSKRSSLGCLGALLLVGFVMTGLWLAKHRALGPTKNRYAVNTAQNLKTAVASFFTEYRRFPGAGEDQTFDLDLASDSSLMDTLLGGDSLGAQEDNPRGIKFFAGRVAKQDPKTGKWKNGVSPDINGGSSLFDPWGNAYRVRLDTDGDQIVHSPIDNSPLNEGVIVWSAGPDGKAETWKDNLRTW